MRRHAALLRNARPPVGVRGVPQPEGPGLIRRIEPALGKEVTTRTWETLGKVVARG